MIWRIVQLTFSILLIVFIWHVITPISVHWLTQKQLDTVLGLLVVSIIVFAVAFMIKKFSEL